MASGSNLPPPVTKKALADIKKVSRKRLQGNIIVYYQTVLSPNPLRPKQAGAAAVGAQRKKR